MGGYFSPLSFSDRDSFTPPATLNILGRGFKTNGGNIDFEMETRSAGAVMEEGGDKRREIRN